jgi:hypothetical protein
MPTDIFRALLADTISKMTTVELRNIIINTPNGDLEAIGAAVLAEKGKTRVAAPPDEIATVEPAEPAGKRKQANPRKVQAVKPTKKKKVVAKQTETKGPENDAGPSKRKCKPLIEATRPS